MIASLPSGPFDVILADPPWRFSANSAARPGRTVHRHYPTMTVEEVAAMPVGDVAARAALLLLWTTAPLREATMHVPRAWGFRFKSELIWDKGKLGLGCWCRNEHETLLICTRGRFPCPRPLFPFSILRSPRREHSRKPDEVQDQLDALYGDRPRLEIFARQERPGWTCWGNDTGRFMAEGAA